MIKDIIYKVDLKNIFEGPMDLLIHLIKKNEMDIYDIPIAVITDQYLEYIRWMKSMNTGVAGDFLLIAATLAQIKSKMLLPRQPDDEDEDPRIEITRPLLEYLKFKAAAEDLESKPFLGEDIFLRGWGKKKSPAPEKDNTAISVDVLDLVAAFRKISEKTSASHAVDMGGEAVSVKEKIIEILEILSDKPSVLFEEMFPPAACRNQMIVTFLAILEMVKMSLARVWQCSQKGVIRITAV